MTRKTRMIMVGAGRMARAHLRQIVRQAGSTRIAAICEPNETSYRTAVQMFRAAGMRPPPNQPDLKRLLHERQGAIDAAFIITPHVYHFEQATMCLEAGLDVLLEKPMVMSAAEARQLIRTRDRTGRCLSIAFQSGLSASTDRALEMLRSGVTGPIVAIHCSVWQDWKNEQHGTWRQDPAQSGGGFLFDTGAHALNMVVRLADEDFDEVVAWMDNSSTRVDILSIVVGRLKSGTRVTISACGNAASFGSDIKVFGEQATLQTDIHGIWLRVQRRDSSRFVAVRVPKSLGVWQQFLEIRTGRKTNPTPPEVGLRLALLWDAIKASAAQGGRPVQLNQEST